jgi:prevent-host-death family protein
MAVIRVSSSEFRAKMKDLANAVMEEQHRVIVTRHNGRMMVVMSWEDFEFCQKHKPQPTPRPVPDPVPDVTENDASVMPLADLERVIAETEEVDDERVQRWRSHAVKTLYARRYFEKVRARPEEERAPANEPPGESTREPEAPGAWPARQEPPPDLPAPAAAASPPSRTGPPPRRS